MKTSKLFGSALLAISLCFSACDEIRTQAGINADLDGDGVIDGTNNPLNPSDPSNPSTPSIRPYKIDMAGVQGFAVVENTSNAPRTKADTNGDGVDDDMPNGNGGEAVNTSPYALYTIDENGELHVSIFYFEVVQSEGDSTDVSYTEVLKEVSNALQIVPSLVTDLGKYILFSGCEYQIIASDISEEALSICQAYISENTRWGDMTYMIRKTDGGLFDFSDQLYFSYYAFDGLNRYIANSYIEGKGVHIVENTYCTSAKDNLFLMTPLGSSCPFVAKFEDNGNAIDVKQMTQNYGSPLCERFIVDKDENIYLFVAAGSGQEAALHIYYANGGFNAYKFETSFSDIVSDFDFEILDLKTDESGVPYIFLIMNCDRNIEEIDEDGHPYTNHVIGQLIISARLKDGVVEPTSETFLPTQDWFHRYNMYNTEDYFYLGCYNNCFHWCLRYGTIPYQVLSYDINTHTCTLKEVSAELNQILVADYDAIVYGSKTYCANIKGNSVEVTVIDPVSETHYAYNLEVDMTSIIPLSYLCLMIQDVPYMIIEGRSPINGAGVSITVNLINGETNSSFAKDGRNVVSFFRIN